MKKVTLIFGALLATLLLSACATQAPRSLLAEQALCVPVGVNEEKLDLCVLNIHNWHHNYWTNNYYLVSDGGISDLEALGGGFQTCDLLVSPSRTSLAVIEDGGEGHPYFTVFNLDDIRNGVKPRSSRSIENYPSGFYDLRWQGELLAFESEVELLRTETSKDDDVSYVQTYLFDPVSGVLEMIGEPKPVK